MSELVTATLVATALQAGQPGWVAVRYDIKPGWHIYWENPGETGIPTSAQLSAPEGWQVGAPRYPGPERFMMPGDLVNYGYEHHAAVLFPVTSEAISSGVLTASTRWLVCRDESCVPGRAQLSLDLTTAQPADLSAFIDQVPTALPKTAQISRDGQAMTVILPDADQIGVFPDLSLEAALQSTAVKDASVVFTFKSPPATAAAAVLRVEHGGVVRYYRVVVGS